MVGAAPSVTSFDPPSGAVGSVITVLGSSFTGTTQVSVGGVAAAFLVDTDGQLRFSVPPGAQTGPVQVANPLGAGQSTTNLVVGVLPSIANLAPGSGVVGTPVTIWGAGFLDASSVEFSGDSCTESVLLEEDFAASAGAFVYRDDTFRGTANPAFADGNFAAAGGEGDGALRVVLGPESTNMSGGFAASFTLPGAPATVSIETRLRVNFPGGYEPDEVGEALLSVDGSLLGVGLDDALFRFVGDAVNDYDSGFLTRVVSVPLAAGSHEIVLGGFNNQSTVAAEFTELFFDEVRVTTTSCSGFSVIADDRIDTQVPAQAVTGPVRVTTPYGIATSPLDFVMEQSPVLDFFTPVGGPPGTEVTITGSGLTGVSSVEFGGVATSAVTVDSDAMLRAEVPQGAITGPIRGLNAAGSGTSAQSFLVGSAPSVDAFGPAAGQIGTQVTVSGSGFGIATELRLNGVVVPDFQVDSDSQIRFGVPAGGSTGPIAITNPIGTGHSATSFVVTVLPTLSSFGPLQGAAGTEVTVTGSGFASALQVEFNGVAAPGFQIDSDSQLRAFVPGAASTGKIRVTNALGSVLSAQNFVVGPAPVVASLTPASGVPGTTIRISGSGFTTTNSVAFTGTSCDPCIGFTVLTDNAIDIVVPSGAASGPVTVTNAFASGQSPSDFVVEAVPFVSGLSPGSGPEGLEVMLDGAGFTGVNDVRFAGTPSSQVIVDSDTRVRAVVPGGAVTGPVSATNAAGTGSSPGDFEVIPTPEPDPALMLGVTLASLLLLSRRHGTPTSVWDTGRSQSAPRQLR